MPPAARPELLRADLKGWLFKLTEGVSIDDYSTFRANPVFGAGLRGQTEGDFRVPKDRMLFAPGGRYRRYLSLRKGSENRTDRSIAASGEQCHDRQDGLGCHSIRE